MVSMLILEYILKEDRDLFTAFVRELRVRMNEEGYLVSVALAPKTSAEQPGLYMREKIMEDLVRRQIRCFL